MKKFCLAILSAVCLVGMASTAFAYLPPPPRRHHHRHDEIVFVKPNGRSYHKRGCERLRYARRVIRITRSEARRDGYRHCPSCFGY